MPRLLPLAALAAVVVALSATASGQECPTGLTYEGQAALCVHIDASCETDMPATSGAFSLKGETCLPHAFFQAADRCTSTGVSAGGPCLVWTDETAPQAEEARAILASYAGGGSPITGGCASGLSVGSVCAQVSTTCVSGFSDFGGACYGAAVDASCEGTGVFLQNEGTAACAAWTNREGADAARAEANLTRLRAGELNVVTDPADLPDGFGTYPAHLTPACMDGIDNDGDGATDYPEAGCTSPFDHEETPEDGEGEAFQFFSGPQIDSSVQMAALQHCRDREQVAADRRAILDYWHLQALQNHLIPTYDYLATGPGTAMDSAFVRLGGSGREFGFNSRHPVDREWNGQVDFAFGWGRGQHLEVGVVCNVSGLVDVRSFGGLGARGAEGGDQRHSWGPFDPEKYRMQAGDPDVRVTEFNRLTSSYLDGFRPAPIFYGSAEVAYLTPDRHYLVTVKTRANSGGYAARMNTPDGFRMVAAPVSIGPWNLCTAGELTQPASALACVNNQGRAEISDPPDASPYVK
ncbi:MAG TPA: hypothetical protein EYQ24_06215 [Bacteroidetes bacterium]|nr:hypothetical protein [Bacteroidota bacterium]